MDGRPAGFWTVAATSFTVILIAEFGDLTQIATATLAARYHDPVSVDLRALLGLWMEPGRRGAPRGTSGVYDC